MAIQGVDGAGVERELDRADTRSDGRVRCATTSAVRRRGAVDGRSGQGADKAARLARGDLGLARGAGRRARSMSPPCTLGWSRSRASAASKRGRCSATCAEAFPAAGAACATPRRDASGRSGAGRTGPNSAGCPSWTARATSTRCTCSSRTRASASVVWSERKDQLAWLHCHAEALKRLGGVPATMRIDNEKTAIATGAGVHGRDPHRVPALLAEIARFHVDACAPRSPEHEGQGRAARCSISGSRQTRARGRGPIMAELQAWSDRALASPPERAAPSLPRDRHERRTTLGRRSSRTSASSRSLPAPFDLVATRRVSEDCLVSFEGRRYSVPFHLVGRVGRAARRAPGASRSCATRRARRESTVRHTQRTARDRPGIHYEGKRHGTTSCRRSPLGRMGKRLAEIAAASTPEQQPAGPLRSARGGGPMSGGNGKKTEPQARPRSSTREKLARLGLEHVAEAARGQAQRPPRATRSSRTVSSTRSSTTSSARARSGASGLRCGSRASRPG